MIDSGVFVLDAGNHIFQWNGKKSNRINKAKGKDIEIEGRRYMIPLQTSSNYRMITWIALLIFGIIIIYLY